MDGTRAHARNESVARMRVPHTARQSPTKPRATPALGADSPANSPVIDTLHFLNQRQRKSVTVKLIAAGTVILGTLYLLYGFVEQQRIAKLVAQRKHNLVGGESHILPQRWREQGVGSTIDGEVLPDCDKILLFKFTNEGGFSSEINHLVRAMMIAQKTRFTVLADDQDWDFGSLSDYFLSRQIHCRPPPDWFVPDSAVALGSRKWQTKSRVVYTRADAPAADAWIRDELLDSIAIDNLHQQAYGHILPEGVTLPPSLEEVYQDAHAALKEIWRPNGHLATMIRRQRIELGLGEGGIRSRKNSPTWGGARKAGAEGKGEDDGNQDDNRDFDDTPGHERGDRGPVIGVHVPLSDKQALWLADMAEAGVAGQSYANASVLVEAAADAVRRLSKSSVAEPGYSRTQASFRAEAKATLLVMTSEAAALPALAAAPLAHEFALLRTAPPPAEELRQWQDLLRMEGEEAGAGEDDRSDVLLAWRQSKFNRLPRSLRVHLTRYFLRDLTTLALHADAFVVRGTSNVGRLACLIGGEDAVVGPRDISGHGLGGRIRAVDAFWYPTSSLGSLYARA